MSRKVLVAGALGVVGRAVIEHFEPRRSVRLVGLSRRAPDFVSRAEFVSVDLRDAAASAAALAAHRDTTHLVYCALHERPQLVRGWREAEQIETNRSMLASTLDALAEAPLEHVTLLQGTKAYGLHVGVRMPVPAREADAHRDHANFYWEQEALLAERAAEGGFRTVIFRPQIVLGVATGSAMNPVAALGAYALLCRERSLPLVHPGHPDAVVECTDARLLARAIEWSFDAEAAANRTFNVGNGDVWAWSDLFSALAGTFGLELGEPAPLVPSRDLAALAPLWRRLAEREGLREPDLERLIGLSWQYSDVLWANPAAPGRPALVSTIALREAGFADCIDTERCLVELLEAYADAGYFPSR